LLIVWRAQSFRRRTLRSMLRGGFPSGIHRRGRREKRPKVTVQSLSASLAQSGNTPNLGEAHRGASPCSLDPIPCELVARLVAALRAERDVVDDGTRGAGRDPISELSLVADLL